MHLDCIIGTICTLHPPLPSEFRRFHTHPLILAFAGTELHWVNIDTNAAIMISMCLQVNARIVFQRQGCYLRTRSLPCARLPPCAPPRAHCAASFCLPFLLCCLLSNHHLLTHVLHPHLPSHTYTHPAFFRLSPTQLYFGCLRLYLDPSQATYPCTPSPLLPPLLLPLLLPSERLHRYMLCSQMCFCI